MGKKPEKIVKGSIAFSSKDYTEEGEALGKAFARAPGIARQAKETVVGTARGINEKHTKYGDGSVFVLTRPQKCLYCKKIYHVGDKAIKYGTRLRCPLDGGELEKVDLVEGR